MLEHFHFIQPFWLLALLPLVGVVWLIVHQQDGRSPWRKVVDARLVPLLLDGGKARASMIPVGLLSAGWLLAVLALADPTWEQQPQPLRQTSTSRVIVLDLSRSMLAADLKPSRLVRARFKVEDILAYDAEGQTGLVVFAGDAFTVSPLTRDAETIRSQLKALHPTIMPSQGSRADLGLLRALELLRQAGVESGQVILIADGAEGAGASEAAARLQDAGHVVSVLAVGTAAGAPLGDGRGGTLRDSQGKAVIVSLDDQRLASIAKAGGGRYSGLHGGPSDLDYLLQTRAVVGDAVENEELQAQKWKEQGPLLAVLLLPLAALAFRRGWMLGVLLCAGTLLPPQPAMALAWDELWQRKDQRAARALDSGDYDQAARLADDPNRRGSAYYRKGDYETALQDFRIAPGADAAYNQGNALARLSRYKEAISAYDRALELKPGMQDALANKATVEAMLDQQRRQQDDSEQQSDQEQSSQQDQASSGQDDSEQRSEQQQSSPQDQASAGQDDSEQQSEQEPSSQQDQASSGQDNGEQPGDQEQSSRQARTSSGRDDSEQGRSSQQQQSSAGQGGSDRHGDRDQSSQQTQTASGDENPDQKSDRDRPSQQAQASSSQEHSDREGDQEPLSQQPQVSGGMDSDDRDLPADSGQERNREDSPQSAEKQLSAAHKGEQNNVPPQQTGTENQFAEATRKLDRTSESEQSVPERGAARRGPGGQPGDRDREVADQPMPAGPRGQPEESERSAMSEGLNDEEKMAAQHWLRRIPDDPGGLLRRKFLYQYRQRGGPAGGGQGW